MLVRHVLYQLSYGRKKTGTCVDRWGGLNRCLCVIARITLVLLQLKSFMSAEATTNRNGLEGEPIDKGVHEPLRIFVRHLNRQHGTKPA